MSSAVLRMSLCLIQYYFVSSVQGCDTCSFNYGILLYNFFFFIILCLYIYLFILFIIILCYFCISVSIWWVQDISYRPFYIWSRCSSVTASCWCLWPTMFGCVSPSSWAPVSDTSCLVGVKQSWWILTNTVTNGESIHVDDTSIPESVQKLIDK